MTVLKKISENNKAIKPELVKKTLILFEFESFFIGDTVRQFSKLKLLREYLSNSEIIMNLNHHIYVDLLKNNPYIDVYKFYKYEEINLLEYDIVICCTYREQHFYNYIVDNFSDGIDNFNVAVFSVWSYFNEREESTIIFEEYTELFEFIGQMSSSLLSKNEIFLEDNEISKATDTLNRLGVLPHEKILVFLDSTTNRVKLLNLRTYFEFLNQVIKIKNIKILIFDEKNINKLSFYEKCLPKNNLNKLVCCKETTLRESISILADSRVKLIFGPCTGLLHCCSGVYEVFLRKGKIESKDIPIMIAYTGSYPENMRRENEYNWWSKTHVNCIKLKEDNQGKRKVTKLTENDKNIDEFYKGLCACNEYRANDLMNFLLTNYSK